MNVRTYIGTLLSAIGLTFSVGEVQAIIALISTILGILLILINIFNKTIGKVKEAKADGHITADEIQEIVSSVVEGLEELETHIENEKK